MTFAQSALQHARPSTIRDRSKISLPRRQEYFPSPVDWRDEVLYFLLVDRFSDSKERPLLNRRNYAAVRPQTWRWDQWAESGANRWQGGTLRGIESRLRYLRQLGVTSLWLSPVFKQRQHEDSYHGYGIQDFLEVDPHYGTRGDLVDLVRKAHENGIRIILDIIFNHSGPNWLYRVETPGGELQPYYTTGRYDFGSWRSNQGDRIQAIHGPEDGVWPIELQNDDRYTRAGFGNLGAGDINDPNAEHKRTDFVTLRDFRLEAPDVLTDLALCYKYWIALTDCDGFRIDTLKHVSTEQARNFCGTIKEFASNLGKNNFFLIGEVAGGDNAQRRYLDVLEQNLDAALDIGEMRLALTFVAKGLREPRAFFDGFNPGAILGSHRNLGSRHVSIADDHDLICGDKVRFSADASSDHQIVAAVALQLLTLGIPCIYYGTEQAFAGPEASERKWLPEWGKSDRYLREAMFGPEHPRKSGANGLTPQDGLDLSLPGFGPFGTAGCHCFDDKHPAYLRIQALTALRKACPVLRHGRQYQRPVSVGEKPFDLQEAGEIIAWSRILDDEEAVCVLNPHGTEARGADVTVDANLNETNSSMEVLLNTAQAADPHTYAGSCPMGTLVPVIRAHDGRAYVEIRDLPPSEVLVLTNRPEAAGTVRP